MSLEHCVINTLEELEEICKIKNSVEITYTNVFSHLRSCDWKLRIFSKPEVNITVGQWQISFLSSDDGISQMISVSKYPRHEPLQRVP